MGALDGQVAIVTGAGQGIGRGIALAVAAEGARVVVLGRTGAKCDAVVGEIAESGGLAVAEQCDVSDPEQTAASVSRTVERWQRLDLLVNNAQQNRYGSIRTLTEHDVEVMWQSGPMGAFRLLKDCFAHLRASQGCVVNLGSGSAVLPQAMMSGYAMAKEAMRALTRVAALEWGRYGIRVNAICPLAATPGLDEFAGAAPGALEATVLPSIPLGRLGDPEHDIGRAVVYLAGPDGRYITGTTLMVDGGYTYLR